MKLEGCFVTGTDTGVGKTRVSVALLHCFERAGWRSAGFKPVAAGTDEVDGILVNEDVRLLRDASSIALNDEEVGPCQLRSACAPHIAAAIEGRHIARAALLAAAHALAQRADRIVAEGAGGFCIPLGDDWDSADLAADLGLPIVLVVGLRLGCLNHALLTAEAIERRGLRLAGWVGNCIDAEMLHREQNIETLREQLQRRHAAACLGVLPWFTSADPLADAVAAARHFDKAALNAAFGSAFGTPPGAPFGAATAPP